MVDGWGGLWETKANNVKALIAKGFSVHGVPIIVGVYNAGPADIRIDGAGSDNYVAAGCSAAFVVGPGEQVVAIGPPSKGSFVVWLGATST